jgi:GNAT superfamily N-acetyltransferase
MSSEKLDVIVNEVSAEQARIMEVSQTRNIGAEQRTYTVRPMDESDLIGVARILVSTGVCDDEADVSRRVGLLIREGSRLCFVAVADRGGRVLGVLIAIFNGFHVFLSHLAVHEEHRGLGVAKRLHEELLVNAARLGAKGVIADSRLTATGFFQRLGYRLPGVVFLINRLEGNECMSRIGDLP